MAGPEDITAPPFPQPVDPYGAAWPPPHWLDPGYGAIAAAGGPPPAMQPGVGIPAAALDAAAAAPPAPPPGTPIVTVGDPTGGPVPLPGPAGELPQPGLNPDATPATPGDPPWLKPNVERDGDRITDRDLAASGPDAWQSAPPDAVSTAAPFPTSDATPDGDRIQDRDPERVNSLEYYANDPTKNPNAAEVQQGLHAMSDEDLAALQVKRDHAQQLELANKQIAELTHQQKLLQQNYQLRMDADTAAQKKADQINADAIALAQRQVDPDRWWNSRSTGQKIAGYIAAIAGGMAAPGMGGRNIGLEQINRAIDQDVEAQKANLQNAWKGIDARKGAVAELFARNRDTFQAAETFRLASLDMVDKQLAIEQQNYDPRGSTALAIEQTRRGIAAQRAAHVESLRRNAFDEYMKAGKLSIEGYDAETRRQAEQDKANKLLKGAGAGAGSGTNPSYTVATGFFGPFTGSPVMGKRAIGGKGEDAKERNTVSAQISTYGHVQDYWAQLAAIGAKIDYHKSLGESVWGRFKSTDAAEYDSARHALVVYLTKELGDKLTQGQLDAQSHRIPERDAILESRDVGKQIKDAQADADRDFSRDMNLVGIDGDNIVHSAQSMRRPPPPPADVDQADAALEAAGKTTGGTAKKDANQALADAEHRLMVEREDAAQGHRDISDALSLPPKLLTLPPTDVREDLRGKALLLNRAADSYAKLLAKFHEQSVDTSYLKGHRGAAGDLVAASKANNAKLIARAREVKQAKSVYDDLRTQIAKVEPWHFDTRPKKPAGMGDVRKDVPSDE